MEIKTGYLYHIKDEFFEYINDDSLMTNHEMGRKRPTYFTIKDGDILWFIPLSSKVDKYEKIVNKKKEKYGVCNSILIRNVLGKKSAILLQNAFPTLEKYIDHVHLGPQGKPAKLIDSLCNEILDNFSQMMKLKDKCSNIFFTDIDKIKNILEDELSVKM